MATTSPWLSRVHDELWARDSFTFIPDRCLPEPEGRADIGDGPRLAFCGFPSDFSLAFCLALLALEVRPVAIITSPGAHPAILGTNALSQIADHLGIPLLRLWRVNDDHARSDLAALDLDGVVMASFDQIVGARALGIPRHGWLNVHPGPLPLYRGPEPVFWTIADGAPVAGVTLHRAVPRFDAGPVLAQRLLPAFPEDDAGTLTRRLCEAGGDALGEAVARLVADDPGDELDMERATYRPSVGHLRLDEAPSAAAAERLVRAGRPNMPTFTAQAGRTLYVMRAAVGPCVDGALRYPDGCLQLLETSSRCGCHHDTEECPHLAR